MYLLINILINSYATLLDPISEEDNVNNYSIENEMENDNLLGQIVSSFQSTGLGVTNCFRCSAHTIQLCVYDGLNYTNYKEILEKAHRVILFNINLIP